MTYYSEKFTADDSRKWGLISSAIGLVSYVAGLRVLSNNKATVCALFIALMIFVVRVFWGLSRKVQFWVLVIALTAIDAIIISIVPDNRWPSSMLVLAPAAALHFGVTYGVLRSAELWLGKH